MKIVLENVNYRLIVLQLYPFSEFRKNIFSRIQSMIIEKLGKKYHWAYNSVLLLFYCISMAETARKLS